LTFGNPDRWQRLADSFVGERQGLDRTLFLLAAGMVAFSFSNPIWQSMHALAWLLLAGEMVRRRRWLVHSPTRWALPWAAFMGWSLLAAALSPAPGQALFDTKKLANLLAIFLFATVLRSARDFLRVLAAAGLVLAAQAALGLVQYATTPIPVDWRIRGTLSHHMTFTGLLLITMCMLLPLLLSTRPRGIAWLGWMYIGLAAAAILASLTRSAWLALIPALVVVLALERPRWLLALPVVLAVLFLAMPQIRHRTLSILDTRGDYSNVHRLSMIPTGLRMIRAHPWLGLGGRRQVRLEYPEFETTAPSPPPVVPDGPIPEPYEPPLHLHSNVLQIAAESGLPALVAWLAALVVYLRQLLRELRRCRGEAESDSLKRHLLVGSLAGCTAFLAMGLLEFNMGDSEVSLLFFLALSVPLALRAARPQPA
jgi:O-antigen ligase